MKTLAALFLLALACANGSAASDIYSDPWSAAMMLRTVVRGMDKQPIGRVRDLVVDASGMVRVLIVESSNAFGLPGRRYAVPWDAVRLMPALAYVAVRFTADSAGDYEMPAERPPRALAGAGAWRVSRLLHERANLRDVPGVGFVRDVLFRANGQIDKVMVSNFFETYAYPFYGYREGAGGYALPYASNQMDGLAPASATKATVRAAPPKRPRAQPSVAGAP